MYMMATMHCQDWWTKKIYYKIMQKKFNMRCCHFLEVLNQFCFVVDTCYSRGQRIHIFEGVDVIYYVGGFNFLVSWRLGWFATFFAQSLKYKMLPWLPQSFVAIGEKHVILSILSSESCFLFVQESVSIRTFESSMSVCLYRNNEKKMLLFNDSYF